MEFSFIISKSRRMPTIRHYFSGKLFFCFASFSVRFALFMLIPILIPVLPYDKSYLGISDKFNVYKIRLQFLRILSFSMKYVYFKQRIGLFKK
jgi:hypothetical protein